MLVQASAKQYGLLDPIPLLARLGRFAQPASVLVPTELLRSAVILYARGLMNSQAIQHNLDWVWPYWVVRQFNPTDEAFVPRAFSVTQINVTNRNWTAIGLPDCDAFPIVDPRGLLTPFLDGWSLDVWLVAPGAPALLPSQLRRVHQQLVWNGTLAVVTDTAGAWGTLRLEAEVVREADQAVCRLRASGSANRSGWLVLALRPYNPEGVSFIPEIEWLPDKAGWKVDRAQEILMDPAPDAHAFSDYRRGDVYRLLPVDDPATSVRCEVGMATAAVLFALEPDTPREVTARVPLGPAKQAGSWQGVVTEHGTIQIPDARMQRLYEAAVRSIILHSPGPIYPGPYTYRRFWFRDAAYIVRALLCVGQTQRAERALDLFPSKQTLDGYFLSQEGEWDSNGEALWAMHQFSLLTGAPLKTAWWPSVARGARWLQRKRLSTADEAPHAGLLPAGFSAEHLGPNDYYYWDDFWGVAGLRAAAALADLRGEGQQAEAEAFRQEAEALLNCITRSLRQTAQRLGRPAMPASPYRRLDAGAIGSVAAGYPLQIFEAKDLRLLDTVDYLLAHSLIRGAFFQEISHAGINPYLTLHLAQVLLRAGDPRAFELLTAVADLASPTGQWPEAVHPRTEGGCMGDGQHIWAAAEWVLMIRNSFLFEEGDRLILCAGLPRHWLQAGEPLAIHQAPTHFGIVSVTVQPTSRGTTVSWNAAWRGTPPQIEVRLAGQAPVTARANQTSVECLEAAALSGASGGGSERGRAP